MEFAETSRTIFFFSATPSGFTKGSAPGKPGALDLIPGQTLGNSFGLERRSHGTL